MARAMVLIWAYSVLLAMVYLVDGIGVNWGTQATQNLHPSVVAQMLKDNKISKVKLFDSDNWTVKYFAGTGIEVMLGIPNSQLNRFSDNYDNAKDWVKENVTKHLYDGGVNIKYVAVGNEPFLKSYNGSHLKTTFPALKNIQKALDAAGVGDKIKATIPQNADVYDSGSQGPSAGDFRSDIRDLMIDIVQFIKDNNAPFVVNIYPFLSLPSSGRSDGQSDGNINANAKMAKRFYDGFFRKMATNKGTPLRPGPIEVYLFSLTDENQKSIAPGDFERHWGIFRYDGQPKFPTDFTGKGQDKMPVGAKNVQYLPQQWCVLNSDIKNMSLVPENVNFACSLFDCTSLIYGSTCNKLDVRGNVSYAFNMYFQMNNQDVEACDFQGLAKIVTRNASQGDCLFPIQIVSDGRRLTMVTRVSVLAGLLTLLALF
ncbi:unnamed protein product [Ilex paraguariensis]|uniref:X8 domain-containing protein n=1 Tax=Ilex paraguariensis TaxID=185542 RepID=A0ABC8SW10_9AQUA